MQICMFILLHTFLHVYIIRICVCQSILCSVKEHPEEMTLPLTTSSSDSDDHWSSPSHTLKSKKVKTAATTTETQQCVSVSWWVVFTKSVTCKQIHSIFVSYRKLEKNFSMISTYSQMSSIIKWHFLDVSMVLPHMIDFYIHRYLNHKLFQYFHQLESIKIIEYN